MNREAAGAATGGQGHTVPSSPPLYVPPYIARDSGLDLAAMGRNVLRRKGVVLAVTAAAVALALLYLVLTPKVYMAEARFLPPLSHSIQALIIDDDGAEKYTPEFVYGEFRKNLRSSKLRRDFFEKNGLIAVFRSDIEDTGSEREPDDRLFAEKFDDKFTVTEDGLDTRFTIVTFEMEDAPQSARILNDFAKAVNDQTVDDLHTDVTTEVDARKQRLKHEIDGKLEFVRLRREDKIIDLEESLQIAQNLGLEDGAVPRIGASTGNSEIAINTAQMPKYLQGSRALEAEIATLKARKDDAPFIPELRNMQEKLDYLDRLSIPRDNISAAIFDQPAIVPEKAVSPRKAIVLGSALILGLMLGVVIALSLDLLSRGRPADPDS